VTASTDAALPRADRFEALEAVRALAACAVLVTHVAFQTGTTLDGPFAGTLARMDVGVALFFALSGFLLFLPYARRRLAGGEPPSARAYFWRRGLRILPAYWLAVVVCFVVLPSNADVTAADWLRHVLLLQVYEPGALRPGLTQTWSLATEVAFYLALPLLATVVLGRKSTARGLRRPLIVLGGLVVVDALWLLGVRVVDPEGILPAGAWLPGNIGWFAVGMTLALLRAAFEHRRHRSARWVLEIASAPGTCWLLAAVLLAIASTPVAGPRILLPTTGWEMVWKFLLYAGVAFFLLLPLTLVDTTASRWANSLSVRPLAWLGRLSYSVFLWHVPVLELVYRVTDVELFQGGFWTVLGKTVAATFVLAAVSYLVVERPPMRLRGLVADRSAGTATTRHDRASTQATEAPLEPAP
jgi:peptidoglycan/LPS O-acetylase OafA/YrhL